MSSVIDPVQRQVDALNAHDLEAFLDCYAPNAVVRLGWSTTLTGHDEIRAFYAVSIDLRQLRAEVLNRLLCSRVSRWVAPSLSAWIRSCTAAALSPCQSSASPPTER
jgi:hypothetical protein